MRKDRIPKDIQKRNFKIEADRGSTLLSMLSVYSEGNLSNVLSKMEWTYLRAPPGTYFFTSDNPVCCWPPRGTSGIQRGIGPSHRDVEITFPLSRRVCAFGAWKRFWPEEYASVSPKQVDVVNSRMVMKSWHFVYGPTRDVQILEWVKEHADTAKKKSSTRDDEADKADPKS